jgi:hypothetical protein
MEVGDETMSAIIRHYAVMSTGASVPLAIFPTLDEAGDLVRKLAVAHVASSVWSEFHEWPMPPLAGLVIVEFTNEETTFSPFAPRRS